MDSSTFLAIGGAVVGTGGTLVGVIYYNMVGRMDRHEEEDDKRFSEFEASQKENHRENVTEMRGLRDAQQRMIGIMLVMAVKGTGDANSERLINAINNLLGGNIKLDL